MAKIIDDFVEEDYEGETDDVLSIGWKLKEIFPKVNWNIEFEFDLGKFMIIVDDFTFYMKDKSFRNWLKILRRKYPKVKFFCCYKKGQC